MTIRSMTGYGQHVERSHDTSISVEVRSVNHRFAEFSIRTPREWSAVEEEIRQLLSEQIRRGKVDAYVTVQNGHATNSVEIDWQLLDAATDAERMLADRLQESFPASQIRDWLKHPSVLQIISKNLPEENDIQLLKRAVRAAMEDLVLMREREGARIESNLHGKLDALRAYAQQVRVYDDEMMGTRLARLQERVRQLEVDVEPERLAQEVALLVDKSAIDEEIVRLLIHLDAFVDALKTPGAIGRRLDFVVQEMHREVNTIGSKTVDPRIAPLVVEMKVLIEQLREQVQNVE